MRQHVFVLPQDAAGRKQWPLGRFLQGYFPNAFAYLAHLSWVANEQHNPGEPMHWARGKSTDQEDTMVRHFLDQGAIDNDGLLHTGKMAWRAMAALENELGDMFGEGVVDFSAAGLKQKGYDDEAFCDGYCDCSVCIEYRLASCNNLASNEHDEGCVYHEDCPIDKRNSPDCTSRDR